MNSTNSQWTQNTRRHVLTATGRTIQLWRLQTMSKKSSIKPLAFALGAAFATTLSSTAVVNAASNPFEMTELSGGYLVTAAAEGKCGGNKANEKSDAEAKCGANKAGDKAGKRVNAAPARPVTKPARKANAAKANVALTKRRTKQARKASAAVTNRPYLPVYRRCLSPGCKRVLVTLGNAFLHEIVHMNPTR